MVYWPLGILKRLLVTKVSRLLTKGLFSRGEVGDHHVVAHDVLRVSNAALCKQHSFLVASIKYVRIGGGEGGHAEVHEVREVAIIV